MDSLAVRVNGKTVAVTPDQIEDQPDDSRKAKNRSEENCGSYDPGRDRSTAVDGGTFAQMLFPAEDGQIAMDRGSLSEGQIAHKDRCVSGDGMTRVDGN